MTVIGVLLILLAVLVVATVFLTGNGSDVELVLGMQLPPWGVFLLGVATVLIIVSGLLFVRMGMRRSLSRRRELREARAVVAERERREGETGAQPTAAETAAAGTAAGTTAGTGAATAAGTDAPTAGTAETAPQETAAPPPGTTDTTGTTPGADDDPGRHAR